MILVDNREGSIDLLPYLIRQGVEASLANLDSADAMLVGNGPEGPVAVGVERKRIRDLVQSLMSGRLMGRQVPAMLHAYPHRWLVIEGDWKGDRDGYVVIPRGRDWVEVQPRIKEEDLRKWIITLELLGGLHIRETSSVFRTVEFLAALDGWWSKPWDEHKGHLAIYTSADAALFNKPRLVRRWAAQLDGIGVGKSEQVDHHFESAHAMATATVDDWMKVRGIGKLLATRAVEQIREGTWSASVVTSPPSTSPQDT